MKITLYHIEIMVILLVLGLPLLFTDTIRTTELIATAAVFFTFLHAQMGNRLQEAEAAKDKPSVENAWHIVLFQIAKESLWVVFFFMTQAWAALVGAIVFLAYPFWRKWYRKRHPLKHTRSGH